MKYDTLYFDNGSDTNWKYRLTMKDSFGEIIEDRNNKRNIRTLERKKKKTSK